MWAARVFVAVFAMTSSAHAVEYKPDARETIAIRPEKPVQRVSPAVPCLTPPERPKRILWLLRDENGNVIIIGTGTTRERC